ncbi:MAG: hypothetical protein MHM6MM_002415 [Cercozoa sp. M6MM]
MNEWNTTRSSPAPPMMNFQEIAHSSSRSISGENAAKKRTVKSQHTMGTGRSRSGRPRGQPDFDIQDWSGSALAPLFLQTEHSDLLLHVLGFACDSRETLEAVSLTHRSLHNALLSPAAQLRVWRPFVQNVQNTELDDRDLQKASEEIFTDWRAFAQYMGRRQMVEGINVPDIENCGMLLPPVADTMSQATPLTASHFVRASPSAELPKGLHWHFRCPLKVSRLQPENFDHLIATEATGPVKFDCYACKRKVKLVSSRRELQQCAEAGECVVYDPARNWLNTMGPEPMVGLPAPPPPVR